MSVMSFAKAGVAVLTGVVASGCGEPKPRPQGVPDISQASPAMPKVDYTGVSLDPGDRTLQIGERLRCWQYDIAPMFAHLDTFGNPTGPLPGSPGVGELKRLLAKDVVFLNDLLREGKRFEFADGYDITHVRDAITKVTNDYDRSLGLPRSEQIAALRDSHRMAGEGSRAAFRLSDVAKKFK